MLKPLHLAPAALACLALALSACGAHPMNVGAAAARGAASSVLQARAVADAPPEALVVTSLEAPLAVSNGKELDHFSFKGATYHLLSASSPTTLQTVLGALRGNRNVKLAEANMSMCALGLDAPGGLPTDEYYPMQYGLIQQHVPDAWKITQGDPSLTVAVVDSGIDFTHPELAGRVTKGPNFLFRPGWLLHRTDKIGPMDDNGHGTHCAGIIGASANDGQGIAGVAPGCQLMAIKALDARGAGTAYDVMKGVAYAVTNGAKIVSLSLGGTSTTSVERSFYESAVQSGVLIVAAAGNSGDAVGFPAAYPGVLSVGATDSGGTLAPFSNHDATLGVTAPGVGILSTVPGNRYEKLSGTSMAAPFVAGVAALVWSAHPDWTAQAVRERIEATATDRGAPGVDALYGHGEVNLMAALADTVTAGK